MMEVQDYSYHVNIPELFRSLGIASPIVDIVPLKGGHLHRMYAVLTEDRRYAVKALNPGVMVRPTAMRNFVTSEEIARVASQKIPAVAANRYHGHAVQQYGEQYYLIYDFINGECLTNEQITPLHAGKLGEILAKLHGIDFSEVEIAAEKPGDGESRNWREYISPAAAWYDIFVKNIDRLYDWNRRYFAASAALMKNAVSHRDLDPKNVMWCGDAPLLIDWEAAGRVDPRCDLFETAVYFSKQPDGTVNKERFKAFLYAYFKTAGPFFQTDWKAIADCGFVLLDWLEYSLKRSLGIECADEEEQKLGTEQVWETLNILLKYDESIPQLVQWVRESAAGHCAEKIGYTSRKAERLVKVIEDIV